MIELVFVVHICNGSFNLNIIFSTTHSMHIVLEVDVSFRNVRRSLSIVSKPLTHSSNSIILSIILYLYIEVSYKVDRCPEDPI